MAESCVFDKQSLEPILCGSLPLRGRAPLVPRVRGQFAEFLHEGSPERLRILSAHTCVGFRYGPACRPRGAFRGRDVNGLPVEVPSPAWGRGCLSPRSVSSRRHPWFTLHAGWGNINPLPIGYALGPRLRSRLTLGGLTFPRKPCAFGGWASHPACRYSFRHSHSSSLHRSSPVRLRRRGRRSPTIHPEADPRLRHDA